MPLSLGATSYLDRRLAASIVAMEAASDRCARLAQEGLVDGYRALIAKRNRSLGMAEWISHTMQSAPAHNATSGMAFLI
jgi:hypothetical protein